MSDVDCLYLETEEQCRGHMCSEEAGQISEMILKELSDVVVI